MDKETIEEITYRIVKNTAPATLKVPPFEIAREAPSFQTLCMLVDAAVNEEREACAVVAEGEGHYMCEDAQDTAKGIADLIRSRSEP